MIELSEQVNVGLFDKSKVGSGSMFKVKVAEPFELVQAVLPNTLPVRIT